MSFRMTWQPTVPDGKAASYELCPLFTHSIGYSEVYRHFSRGVFPVEGGFFLGGSLHGGIFNRGKKFSIEGEPDFSALFEKTIRN